MTRKKKSQPSYTLEEKVQALAALNARDGNKRGTAKALRDSGQKCYKHITHKTLGRWAAQSDKLLAGVKPGPEDKTSGPNAAPPPSLFGLCLSPDVSAMYQSGEGSIGGGTVTAAGLPGLHAALNDVKDIINLLKWSMRSEVALASAAKIGPNWKKIAPISDKLLKATAHRVAIEAAIAKAEGTGSGVDEDYIRRLFSQLLGSVCAKCKKKLEKLQGDV